jgi:hypothetical protein
MCVQCMECILCCCLEDRQVFVLPIDVVVLDNLQVKLVCLGFAAVAYCAFTLLTSSCIAVQGLVNLYSVSKLCRLLAPG